MNTIQCPQCKVTGPVATRIGVVAVCGSCGSSIVIEGDGTIRRAVAHDTEGLGPRDLALLRQARAAIIGHGR